MEGRSVADRSDDRSRNQGAYAGDLPESLAGWIGRGDLLNLFVHRDDLLVQVLPLAPQQADEVAHAWCEVRICVLEDLRHRLLQLEGSLGEHHATLEQEGSQLVDDGRSMGDKPVAHAMHRLEIKLVVRLDRNKPHVLSVYRFGNGFRIKEVVLVRLHEWLHELRRNQLHVMALFSQNTTEEVSTRTSLHPYQGRLHVSGEGDELLLRELLPQQHLACCAQSYEVKGSLAEINTNRTNLHIDDPP